MKLNPSPPRSHSPSTRARPPRHTRSLPVVSVYLLLSGCQHTIPSSPTPLRSPPPLAKPPVSAAALTQRNSVEPDNDSRFREIIPAGRLPNIPVIMYHDVLPRKEVWFDETLTDFKRQLAEMRSRGFQAITTRQLWLHLTTGAPVPPRSIVLTFDDANEGQFLYALPVLQQYHWPAIFFIHTGYVGVTTSKRHMTWDQLKQAEATGLIDVEARTVTHPCNMPDLTPQQLSKELTGAQQAVQQHLGRRSVFFSYPCGHFSASAETAVKTAGYILAFDEERGFANRSPSILAVNRFTPRRLNEALHP